MLKRLSKNKPPSVGDMVILDPANHYELMAAVKVARVTKTSITLDNGKKFTIAGREWGKRGYWSVAYIRPATDDNVEAMERHNKLIKEKRTQGRLLNLIRGQRFNELPIDILESIVALLQKHDEEVNYTTPAESEASDD